MTVKDFHKDFSTYIVCWIWFRFFWISCIFIEDFCYFLLHLFQIFGEGDVYLPVDNKVIWGDVGVSGYGGQCRCPNGGVYDVGSKDGCLTIECIRGVAVELCEKVFRKERSRKGVVCEPLSVSFFGVTGLG